MRLLIIILTCVLVSQAQAGGSLTGPNPTYQWQRIAASTSVAPSATSTPSTIYVAYPAAGGCRVIQIQTTSATPTEANMSVLVSGSCDMGDNFADVTHSTSITRITADGTYLYNVSSPEKDVTHNRVTLQNHSDSVTTSVNVWMGSN